jgi:hypothetical protein
LLGRRLQEADRLCLAKTPSGFKINKILQGSVTSMLIPKVGRR